MLDHHPGIGGRFSVLTNVGLLPALARGLDARAVRAGARERGRGADGAPSRPRDFAPAVGAAVAVALARERGIRAQVMMPYADRLGRFCALVRAAVGREPRQGRPGHGADRLPRPASTSTASCSCSWTGRAST